MLKQAAGNARTAAKRKANIPPHHPAIHLCFLAGVFIAFGSHFGIFAKHTFFSWNELLALVYFTACHFHKPSGDNFRLFLVFIYTSSVVFIGHCAWLVWCATADGDMCMIGGASQQNEQQFQILLFIRVAFIPIFIAITTCMIGGCARPAIFITLVCVVISFATLAIWMSFVFKAEVASVVAVVAFIAVHVGAILGVSVFIIFFFPFSNCAHFPAPSSLIILTEIIIFFAGGGGSLTDLILTSLNTFLISLLIGLMFTNLLTVTVFHLEPAWVPISFAGNFGN
jgi:hypothetical protein